MTATTIDKKQKRKQANDGMNPEIKYIDIYLNLIHFLLIQVLPHLFEVEKIICFQKWTHQPEISAHSTSVGERLGGLFYENYGWLSVFMSILAFYHGVIALKCSLASRSSLVYVRTQQRERSKFFPLKIVKRVLMSVSFICGHRQWVVFAYLIFHGRYHRDVRSEGGGEVGER